MDLPQLHLPAFIGKFIIDVQHKSKPISYSTHFYLFQDSASHQILLLYVASKCLGTLKFKVPIELPTTILDAITMMNTLGISNHITFTPSLEVTLPETPSQPFDTEEL